MARDSIHKSVKQALIKEGWVILADPFQLEYQEFRLLIEEIPLSLLVVHIQREEVVSWIKPSSTKQ